MREYFSDTEPKNILILAHLTISTKFPYSFKSYAILFNHSKGASTLLVLVLVLARLVLVGRLVWLLLVLVNLRPHYFS
jgi:hypothetical protein